MIYIDNQYIDVDQQQGTATQVINAGSGTENVTYSQNIFQLSGDIPTGTFLLITPNYFWENQNGSNTNFIIKTDPNSEFVIDEEYQDEWDVCFDIIVTEKEVI